MGKGILCLIFFAPSFSSATTTQAKNEVGLVVENAREMFDV